jgi:hypothetical protein
MTYSLELMFYEPLKEGIAHNPIAQIYVKTHSQDEKGRVLITPHCVSLMELDHEIDRLKEELDQIRIKAKRKFDKERSYRKEKANPQLTDKDGTTPK